MLLIPPTNRWEVMRVYERLYDEGITNGDFVPLINPVGAVAPVLIIAFLLTPPCKNLLHEVARYVAFGALLVSTVYTITYCRCRTTAPAFGIGLLSAWTLIWIATLTIFNDAKTQFKRIERSKDTKSGSTASRVREEKSILGSKTSGAAQNGNQIRQRLSINASEPHESLEDSDVGPSERTGRFGWQGYPQSPLTERLDWVLDLLSSFRGVGWNWCIYGLPSKPVWVQRELLDSSAPSRTIVDVSISRTGIKRYDTRKALLYHNIKSVVILYLCIDMLKTLTNHDPYFWGYVHSAPPSYYPDIILSSPVLIRSYRLLVIMTTICMALAAIFNLAGPFFVGLLGARRIGARGEPWYYPDSWGSYRLVFDKGLAGWWGGWWHQTFRYAFESGGRWTLGILGLDSHTKLGKAVHMIIAFGLSGFLHAAGSATELGDTRPLRGPFRFFLIQPLGILSQRYVSELLRDSNISTRAPQWLRQATNFVFVHVWFYWTAPLLCDDWARGGIYLFEPLPFSPVRALGFGVPGDRFWCWSGQFGQWHTGRTWWSSGYGL